MLTSLISLFIQSADATAQATSSAADATSAAPASGFAQYQGIIMIVLMIAIFYFLLIRPQQKKQKEIRKMREALSEGDQVITAGGIYGKIASVKDNYFLISVSDGVKIKVAKDSVYVSPEDAQAAQQQGK